MPKTRAISLLLLYALLYTVSDTARAQGNSFTFQKQRSETISLVRALKKVSDLFNTQFVYEKSLLEGKTTVYNEKNIKGKPVEDVLKDILYSNGLIFLCVKGNYYSIVAKGMLNENRNKPKEAANKSRIRGVKSSFSDSI